MFLAHIAQDGREQSVEEHLQNTADLSGKFAAVFGAEAQGKLLGLAHDLGKCSEAFQKRLKGGKVVDHATAGAVECAKSKAVWASCCITGHHGGLSDFGNPKVDGADDPTLCGRLKKKIPEYSMPSLPELSALLEKKMPFPPNLGKDGLTDSFVIRMLYSCLVDADYLDTEQFMSNGTVQRGNYASMPELLQRLEAYIQPWLNPKKELNLCRCAVLQACLEQGKRERGLYALTVPTGGGKTVSSLAFALRHAVQNKMDRIIYVIPYISIIEQTAAIFKEILGEENVIEHHSDLVYDPKEDLEGAKNMQILATENWDAPIIVTTAVQFFESLYANRPSKCRKLHNIANSVIIFDESQMMPRAHLEPCVAAIAQLVQNFRATALLCTATQPVLDELFQKFSSEPPVQIYTEFPSLYKQLQRITFRQAGKLKQEELVKELADKFQVLCIVNTRQEARKLYQLLPGEDNFHLSTLMIPVHRRKILKEIRERLQTGQPCRVIATSLIEAGVDVDFPAVYREMAGLDSILQAAGRCNREGARAVSESVVTVYEGEQPAPPLFKLNIGAAREVLRNDVDPADPQTIKQYFETWLDYVGENGLDKAEMIKAFKQGIAGCALPFKQAAEKFHFIDAENRKTIYIPFQQKGKEITQRLLDGEVSRSLYREAGQYSVSVYNQDYENLLKAGDIMPLDEAKESAVLQNENLYFEDTGLSLEVDWGKAEFI